MPGLDLDPQEWAWIAHGIAEGEILKRRRTRAGVSVAELAAEVTLWTPDLIVHIEAAHSVSRADVNTYRAALLAAQLRKRAS